MRFAFLFLAGLITFYAGSAQQVLPTQSEPVAIFNAGNYIHVLTARVDKDFDGNMDEGDSPASWTTFDKSTFDVILETNFPWADVAASRVGFNAISSRAYIAIDDSVLIYSLNSHSLIGILDKKKAYAVSADGQRVYLSRRPSFTDPGTVDIEVPGSLNITTLPTGINPQLTKYYRTSSGGTGFLVVNEGDYGQNNGTVDLYSSEQSGYTRVSLNVGDTPNFAVVEGDSAYIIVNGSHSIVVIDLQTKLPVDTIPTQTSGLDGPREAAVNNGFLYVTTYTGDVRIFNLVNKELIRTVQCNAKPDALAIIDNRLFITRTFVDDTYNPYSGIIVYTLDEVLSVAEAANSHHSSAAFFAAGASIILPMFEGASNVQIIDMNGRRYESEHFDKSTLRLELSSFPEGIYIVTDGKASVVVGK